MLLKGFRLMTVCGASLAIACDRSPTPIETPPITVAVSPATIEMVAGATSIPPAGSDVVRMVDVVVYRNGYDGPVAVQTSLDAPAGATSPLSITWISGFDSPDDTVGVVGFTAPDGTTPGDYVLTIGASTDALGSVTDTVTVQVRAFDVRRIQERVVISRGATKTVSFVVRKDATVQLEADASLSPAEGATTSTEMTDGAVYVDLSIATNASTGTRSLTMVAEAAGRQQTLDVEVVVQDAQPTRPVSFRICHNRYPPGMRPFFVHRYAYANDGEGWMAVTPDVNDVIQVMATERVSILEHFSYPVGPYSTAGTGVRVVHLTAADLEEMQCPSARSTGRVFSVDGQGADRFHVAAGAFRTDSESSMYVPGGIAGPIDLVASGALTGGSAADYRAIVRRGMDPAPSSTLLFDFESTEAVALQSASLSVEGASAIRPVVHLHTATTVGRLGGLDWPPAGGEYFALPETFLLSGETQSVMVATPTRGVVRYIRDPEALALTLGPELVAPTVDTNAQTIALPSQSEYPDIAGVGQLSLRDARGVFDYLEVWQTRAFLGATPSAWTFIPPDLGRLGSTVPWFSTLWHDTAIGAIAGVGRASLFFGGRAASGDMIRWAKRHPDYFAITLPYPSEH